MKKYIKSMITLGLAGLMLLPATQTQAGNKDRTGEAGASELLINPWAGSSGWGGANMACVKGLEAIYNNVAGTVHANGTEVIFSQTQWLKGSEINISNFGFTQKIGETSALSLAVMAMNFGDIAVKTEDQPEGNIGNFSPSYMNISLAYAKAFSNSIFGGVTIKVINEAISDISAQGVAIDAGIQYVTGPEDNVRFGVSLRNIGPAMSYSGDGLSIRTLLPGKESMFTVEHRSSSFQLPSQLNIGGAYDFNFENEHRLTVAGNFNSNSFNKDQWQVGMEYSLKNYLLIHGGYVYEEGLWDEAERTTVFTGPSAGASVQIPLNKENGSIISIDYSYRATNPFDGVHTFGAKISL